MTEATTVKVEHKYAPMPHHIAGLSWTASGYGARIPSSSMVHYLGRWRRIYTSIWSNAGTAWVRVRGKRHIVENYGADYEVSIKPWE